MAKKQTRSTNTRKVVVEQNQEMVLEEPVIVKTKTQKPKKDDWEIRDRVYYLMGNKKPISRMIKSANLYWFGRPKREPDRRQLSPCALPSRIKTPKHGPFRSCAHEA